MRLSALISSSLALSLAVVIALSLLPAAAAQDGTTDPSDAPPATA